MLSINQVLQIFKITQEDIVARSALKDKLPLLSDILVDRFYTEYIKDNKEVAHYFRYTNMEIFSSKMKEFIVFIYSAPLNQNYLERIHEIGYIHAEIKLDSAEVKYGFFGLNQLLLKLSTIDSVVKKNFMLLSKILAMVEYVIVDSTYYKVNKASSDISHKSSIWMLDKIYSVFSIHKENYSKLERFMHTKEKNILEIDTIVNDPNECKFHTLLSELEDETDLLKASGIDLEKLQTLHTQWHALLIAFKSATNDEESIKQQEAFKQITVVTNELYELMDRPLKEFSTSGFLSLNTGLKAISSINTLFSKGEFTLTTEDDIKENIMNHVKRSLLNTMSWAIEKIEIYTTLIDNPDYDLIKKLKFKKHVFYLGISLKPLANKLYLKEVIILLLEALELNFSIKEREHSLLEYAEQAQIANRSKDVFISSMSHELRTPLTAVNGYSEVLMMRPDTPENIKGYLKKINLAGNNLLDLVNTILSFAKLEASSMKFKPTLSSVYLILQEVEILSVPMAQDKNISLDIVVDLNLYLLLDPKLFKQVLLNLVSNAIKFTPRNGSVTLSINYDEEKKEYKFSVCDTGIGISPKDQEKLFHSFVQIDNVYQDKTSGSGLGLMICKKIIEELHQGKIWIESEVHKGSCFHVSIPVLDPVVNSYCIENASKNAKHILIVEDSHMYQELFKNYLEEKFTLTFTDTNNGAKNILSTQTFDMLILDFYLTDGISSEILTFMEEEDINIPVVLISVEDDLHVAHTIYESSNLERIINKKDIKDFCKILNPNLK